MVGVEPTSSSEVSYQLDDMTKVIILCLQTL
jgi:hypothetical protein